MFLRVLPLALVALMMAATNAGAASVGAVKIFDGQNCQIVPQQTFMTKSFDLTVLPGARVVLAGNAAGTLGVAPLIGTVAIRVDHVDGTFSQRQVLYPQVGPPCNQSYWGVVDITDLFKFPTSTNVQVTLGAQYHGGNGNWYFGSSPIYIVGLGGVAGANIASVQG